MAPPTFMGLTGRPLSLAVSTVATTGFVLFGYDQGVMSGIITSPVFNDIFAATKDNSTMQGVVTAIYDLGCLFGAIFILTFGDFLGRRRSMMMGGTIMILGVLIQVTSEKSSTPLAQFIVGRTITGVGNGINTSTIPTYQAECSRTSNRGLLICIEGGIIFALVVSIGIIWLPESPRWLLSRGRDAEGETVIAALRGLDVDAKETQLQKQVIMDSINASGYGSKKGTPIKAVFTGGRTQHFRRMLLGVSSQLMQQLYPAEINPIKTRAKANALSTCSNWLFNFRKLSHPLNLSTPESFAVSHPSDNSKVIVMVTPVMISNIKWGTYLFFAIVNACFLPIIYFLYPETARRSLEEVDIIFAKGYQEGISYVKAAKELPFLEDEEIDARAREFGLVGDGGRVGVGEEEVEVEGGKFG
ncbi:uncharacterized protein KY384_007209 [Bacidia gigantensis]|uniref:uncharacterized protein n=1 Tax=Bacidia gigantensis TaxID=2732470 RepID=UPI001D04FC91|nr:uncharacterized protein KY384_007209 [Bacidia gigantensis]KAG8528292.1 hypothetical protein KY384_007209 [Bacidia gigantensis]